MSSRYNPSNFQKFFWLISGSEIHVLKDCKNDYNRHATMGFILFMTWLFATFAGGFAGWYFGHSLKPAFGFGLMWGLMIYAIDRGMVVSLKKNPTIENQPFWFPFLTRAVLGIVIAFFISIPFEILIFNEDIKIQMEKDKDTELGNRLNVQNTIYDTKGQETRLANDKKEVSSLEAKLNAPCPLPEYQIKQSEFISCVGESGVLLKKYKRSEQDYFFLRSQCPIDTATNKPILTSEARSARDKYISDKSDFNIKDKLCLAIKKEADKISTEYFEDLSNKKGILDTLVSVNTVKLTSTTHKIDSIKLGYEKMLSGLDGFTRQYVALNNASKSNWSLLFLMWLVRFAFFVIEILPTLYKLKTPIGDYDRAIFYREAMFKEEMETDLESKKKSEESRKKHDGIIAEKTERHRARKEVELNKELIDKVANIQMEIAISHLSEWEKREKDGTEKKIDDFIKSKS